jgi:hypothetical protein
MAGSDDPVGLDARGIGTYIRRAMKTIVSSLVLLGCLALPAGRPRAAGPGASPEKGKVLVLENEHTLEGDIERVGDRYRVRRAVGETWLPADRVLCLVASLPDAYAFLRGRANLEDADERLRLADWCRLNGLRTQALAELRAAAQLRPAHAETRRLLEVLQQAEHVAAVEKPAADSARAAEKEPAPPVEVTTESLGLFATRVQPILMNTCASCHATGRGGRFHLLQAYDGGLANRRTLERNLAATLAQVDLDRPEASRLLSKAVSDHAHTGQAPLKGRTAPPFRTLEDWVKLTVANSPRPGDARPSPGPGPTAPERRPAAEATTQWGADTRPPASAPPASTPMPAPVPSAAPPPPDPYDPEPFNRQMHPETSKPGPAK